MLKLYNLSTKKTWRTNSLRICSLALSGLLILISGCNKNEPQINFPPPKVLVFKATTQKIATEFEYIGHTEPSKIADIRSRVTGNLIQTFFTEGQDVKQGQLLFKIDPTDYQLTLDQTKAKLNVELANMSFAQKDYDRSLDLYKNGSLSEIKLDTATKQKDQAIAVANVAREDVNKANLNLNYTKIYAPFSGKIGESKYDIGNLITADSNPLAVLVATNPIVARFQIKEQQVLKFLQSRKIVEEKIADIKISLVNPETNEILLNQGNLTYISPTVDKSSAMLTAKVEFNNHENKVIPGLYVKIKITLDDQKPMIVIPKSCIAENQSGKYLWVVKADSKVERRYIQVKKSKDQFFVIDKGINEGEHIIIEGTQKVYPDATVTALEVQIDPDSAAISSIVSEGR